MIIDTFLESLPPAVIGGVAALVWATTVGSIGLWTYRDARARESGSPVLWEVGLVFALVLFPLYFYLRRPERNTPPARLDRGLATLASSGVSAFLVGAVFSPPDPITQASYLTVCYAVLLPLAFLLVYRGGSRRFDQSGTV